MNVFQGSHPCLQMSCSHIEVGANNSVLPWWFAVATKLEFIDDGLRANSITWKTEKEYACLCSVVLHFLRWQRWKELYWLLLRAQSPTPSAKTLALSEIFRELRPSDPFKCHRGFRFFFTKYSHRLLLQSAEWHDFQAGIEMTYKQLSVYRKFHDVESTIKQWRPGWNSVLTQRGPTLLEGGLKTC